MKDIRGLCITVLAASVLFSTGTVQAGLTGDVNDFLFRRTATKVVESYTDNTVVKTIELLRNDIEELNSAAQRFGTSRSITDLEAAGRAMKASFAQFNKARSFRYGPSAHYDFDKQLATWPFDKVFVDHLIAEIKKGAIEINPSILRWRNSSNRGLHTVKYLIYDDNGNLRKPQDLNDATVVYLTSATAVLLEDAVDYEASWKGTRNMSVADQELLKNAGKKIRTSYAREFKNPGEEYSRYFSVSVPLQELIGEAATVLEDMVPLIKELPKYGDPEEIRYWDSVTPFADIINQLKGVENSYMGGIKGTRGPAYRDLVEKKDEQLSERIVISFAHAIKRAEVAARMNDQPFEKREQAAKLLLAEVEKLTTMLFAATPLVAADRATDPFAVYGSDIN